MVARGVVRVVTAGTITDDEHLDEKQNSYVCCVCKDGETVALAWADIRLYFSKRASGFLLNTVKVRRLHKLPALFPLRNKRK